MSLISLFKIVGPLIAGTKLGDQTEQRDGEYEKSG